VNYRESYGIYACNGILFNHESPLRGETFVTRKATRALARIKLGLQSKLYLGNLDAKRDWGHARDYVEMQWLMLQQNQPDDYVIATGVQFTVRELVTLAASFLDIHLSWVGTGVEEKGFDQHGKAVVVVDPRYFRPAEVQTLLGDSSKARRELNWSPQTDFRSLVEEMTIEDLRAAERDALISEHGYLAYSFHES
jgi:GDPmannose 4,6-dehydratase